MPNLLLSDRSGGQTYFDAAPAPPVAARVGFRVASDIVSRRLGDSAERGGGRPGAEGGGGGGGSHEPLVGRTVGLANGWVGGFEVGSRGLARNPQNPKGGG